MDHSIINISEGHHTIPMACIPMEEYNNLIRKHNELENRKNVLETNLNSLNLCVEKYIEEIKILKEEKRILEETITQLNKRIEILESEIKIRDNRIEKLETKVINLETTITDLKTTVTDLKITVTDLKTTNEELKITIKHNKKLTMIGQCITNYKDILKKYIYGHTDIQNDVFKILTSEKIKKTPEQQIKIDKIKNHYDKIFNTCGFVDGIDELSSHISDIKYERNMTSHPYIKNEEYKELKILFLEYCNENWTKYQKTNEKITNNIFEVLMDGELKI